VPRHSPLPVLPPMPVTSQKKIIKRGQYKYCKGKHCHSTHQQL